MIVVGGWYLLYCLGVAGASRSKQRHNASLLVDQLTKSRCSIKMEHVRSARYNNGIFCSVVQLMFSFLPFFVGRSRWKDL